MMRPIKQMLLLALTFSASRASAQVVANASATSKSSRYMVKGELKPEHYAACQETFFPRLENRVLKDMPITILVTSQDGAWKALPATGLDAYGFWLRITRPACEEAKEEKTTTDLSYLKPKTGASLFFITAADVMLLQDSKTVAMQVPGAMTNVETTQTQFSVFLNAGTGLMLDVNWFSGGHGNHVALGFLARAGYLFGVENRFYWTIGPAVSLSVF